MTPGRAAPSAQASGVSNTLMMTGQQMDWNAAPHMLAKKSRLVLSEFEKMALMSDAAAMQDHIAFLDSKAKRQQAQRDALQQQIAEQKARKDQERQQLYEEGRKKAADAEAFRREEEERKRAALQLAQTMNGMYAQAISQAEAARERAKREQMEAELKTVAEIEAEVQKELVEKQRQVSA